MACCAVLSTDVDRYSVSGMKKIFQKPLNLIVVFDNISLNYQVSEILNVLKGPSPPIPPLAVNNQWIVVRLPSIGCCFICCWYCSRPVLDSLRVHVYQTLYNSYPPPLSRLRRRYYSLAVYHPPLQSLAVFHRGREGVAFFGGRPG